MRRDIDPQTGDYILVNGAPRLDDTRASKVVFRLRKRRGTGIYPHIGSRLHQITRNAPGALRLAEAFAVDAVRDLVASGEIRDVTASASTEFAGGTTMLVIEMGFRDTAGDQRVVRYEQRLGA